MLYIPFFVIVANPVLSTTFKVDASKILNSFGPSSLFICSPALTRIVIAVSSFETLIVFALKPPKFLPKSSLAPSFVFKCTSISDPAFTLITSP